MTSDEDRPEVNIGDVFQRLRECLDDLGIRHMTDRVLGQHMVRIPLEQDKLEGPFFTIRSRLEQPRHSDDSGVRISIEMRFDYWYECLMRLETKQMKKSPESRGVAADEENGEPREEETPS